MAVGAALGTGACGITVVPGSETMVAAGCVRTWTEIFLGCGGFEGFGLAEMLGV
jgi:hypothetical protein